MPGENSSHPPLLPPDRAVGAHERHGDRALFADADPAADAAGCRTDAHGRRLAGDRQLSRISDRRAVLHRAYARPAPAIRWGLLSVGPFTLAMGFSDWQPLWLALRFLAGVASAFVLVGMSAWTMPILARHGREQWSGHVFSGVGIGIAFAGLFGLAAGIDAWSSRATWVALGVVAMALAAALWRPLAATLRPPRRPHRKAVRCCRALLLSPRPATPLRLRLHYSRDLPSGAGARIYR